MTKATHTPGPWYVRTGPPNDVAVHWSEDGQICPLRWTDGLRPETEARVAADARLIAAAPELLAATRFAREWLAALSIGYPANGIDPLIAMIDSAIAKAEARS